MNNLDAVSYYLSWTDCILIVSIPSAIVHLICAVRDRSITPRPPQVYPVPVGETLKQELNRKFDNWTHLRKGILAIIPVIGNAILFANAVLRKISVFCMYPYLNGNLGAMNQARCAPGFLFQDRKFLKTVLQMEPHGSPHVLFNMASSRIRSDKRFVLELINDYNLDHNIYQRLSPALRNDPDIIAPLCRKAGSNITTFFIQLPQTLKNDPNVAQAAFTSASIAGICLDQIVSPLNNNLILGSIEEDIHLTALRIGKLLLKDFPPNLQNNPKYALAALENNLDNWVQVPLSLRNHEYFFKNVEELIGFEQNLAQHLLAQREDAAARIIPTYVKTTWSAYSLASPPPSAYDIASARRRKIDA